MTRTHGLGISAKKGHTGGHRFCSTELGISRRVRTSEQPIIFGSRGGGGPSDNAEFASLQVERDAYDRLEKARLLLVQKLEGPVANFFRPVCELREKAI
jgi:hypothetical protein